MTKFYDVLELFCSSIQVIEDFVHQFNQWFFFISDKLSHLLGGYQSDSDDEHKNKSTEVTTGKQKAVLSAMIHSL